MIKFYNVPLLTAGGLSYDFNEPKANNQSEFHLLTKTGFSYVDTVKAVFSFFER